MNSMKCPQCGLVNWATAEACKRCRLPINGASKADFGRWDENSTGYEGEPAHQWSERDQQEPSYTYAGAGQVPQKNGIAIASMVVGIVNMLACGLFGLGSITGLVLGIIALVKAKGSPLKYGGQGFAIAGIALSVVSILYMGIVLSIAIPNLIASYRAANEGAALRTLMTIADAESKFQSAIGEGRYGTLQELAAAGLIDAKIVNGVQHRYVFEVKTDGESYEAMATPVKDDDFIGRSFYFSSREQFIRAAKKGGVAATAFDPPMEQYQAPGYRNVDQREERHPTYSPAY
jgi:type II secretory pathway pseudopilin PulG